MTEPSGDAEGKANEVEDWREITEKITTDEQYQYMQEHDILTDCTFVVGPEDSETREFKAHRVCIARVSPMFEAMLLRGEMIEAQTGHVRITDLSPDTFQLLLNSIYGKNPATSFQEAKDLAFAADKYQTRVLLENCVTQMSSLITPENIWVALETADLLRNQRLKETCIQFLQRDTLRCMKDAGFMQTSEGNVALLLEQDELNVVDELLLVNAVVHWARHAARQRGLSDDDSGVRAVLVPRLLKLMRLLAMSPQQFMLGPDLAGWLTDDEKFVIPECLRSGNFSKMPSHLSAVAQKRKNSRFMESAVQIKGKKPSVNLFCKREIIVSRPNVMQAKRCCSIPYGYGSYYMCLHATLIFKVNSSCQLLGFQCPSRCRADFTADPTAFTAKKPIYQEHIVANTFFFNHTLSTDFEKSRYGEFMYRPKAVQTDCNTTISFLFDNPVPLVPDNWFAIEIKLQEYCGQVPGQYPNPSRSQRVCTAAGVEFEFRTEEQDGYYSSKYDGIFESLIFSL